MTQFYDFNRAWESCFNADLARATAGPTREETEREALIDEACEEKARELIDTDDLYWREYLLDTKSDEVKSAVAAARKHDDAAAGRILRSIVEDFQERIVDEQDMRDEQERLL